VLSLLSALERLETWQAREGLEIAIASTKKVKIYVHTHIVFASFSRHFKDFALHRLAHRFKSVVTSACDVIDARVMRLPECTRMGHY
jgi:hypothetical protein